MASVTKDADVFKWEHASFDDIIDYVAELIGGNFQKAVLIGQDMLENPDKYTGIQAAMAAQKLAVHRQRVGTAAEFYKLRASHTGRAQDKLTKGALIVMYDSLMEIINCLKKQATHEKDMIG